jgi:hypothetical protein
MSAAPIYVLAGGRQGCDFSGLARFDCSDGYTEFNAPDGTVKAVVLTCLLMDAPKVRT